MKLFKNTNQYHSNSKSVVTIGTFDGVHIGHQKILKKVKDIARAEGLESTVLTFFPHPRMVLQPDVEIKLIQSIEEREESLNKAGIDNLVIHPFNKAFSRLTARQYVEQILVNQLKAAYVVIGYDHRFGRNRSADISDLNKYAKLFNFKVVEIHKKEWDEVAVSSTKIRHALAKSKVSLAKKYMQHCYTLSGKVVKGKAIGRSIGFPTANLEIKEQYKIIPKQGVYITTLFLEGKEYLGLTNIGENPTVSGTSTLKVETHILGYSNSLYGIKLQLFFHKRLRDEQKFSTLEDLKKAINQDLIKAKAYAKKNLSVQL